MQRTLEEFLTKKEEYRLKSSFSIDEFNFMKILTLKQFLTKCKRADLIIKLFEKSNPDDKRIRSLVVGHCVNTISLLFKSYKLTKAVDDLIKYGRGKISLQELEKSALEASDYFYFAYDLSTVAEITVNDAASLAAFSCRNHDEASTAINRANDAVYYHYYEINKDIAQLKRNEHQKTMVNICNKFLPLSIWNI